MAKMGRPKVELNWDEFEKLCEIQCTAEEVSFWFRCSVDTVERAVRRKYKSTFAEVVRQKSVRGKIAIRRALFSMALKENLGALIWLSKNHLGMAEKVETKGEIELASTDFSPEEVIRRRERINKKVQQLQILDES